MERKFNLMEVICVLIFIITDITINIYFKRIPTKNLLLGNFYKVITLLIIKYFPLEGHYDDKGNDNKYKFRFFKAFVLFNVIENSVYYLFIRNIESNLSIPQYFMIQILFIVLLLVSMRLCKVNFLSLPYGLNLKTILLTGIVSALIIISNLSRGFTINKSILAINIVTKFFYPCAYEEIIYRGLLMNGLECFNLSKKTINIIQCIIFGLLHYNSYLQYGIFSLIFTSFQILSGYLLGKVYIKTNSLMPCILIHIAMDL